MAKTTLEVRDVVVENADELPPVLTELIEHVDLVGLAVVEVDLTVFPHQLENPRSERLRYAARLPFRLFVIALLAAGKKAI